MTLAAATRSSVVVSALLLSSPAQAFWGPGTYEECLLDRLPGTANDSAAKIIMQSCLDRFPRPTTPPSIWAEDEKQKKSGFFHPSAQDCALKYGKSTPSPLAGRAIVAACHIIYERQ